MTRLLVVEDEESIVDALSYMLRKEGFEVAVVNAGPAALDEMDRTGADLVLLDLMLPGLPGTEVCRQLRQRSNVPVIMLTAKDSEVDKVVGLELGADDYVTKPVTSRELVARIRAVLRRRSEPEEVPSATLGGSGADGGPAGHGRRHRGTATAEGVRTSRAAAAQRGPGTHPDATHRSRLGQRLRRGHQDPRRPHQAAAREDRARPEHAALHRDRARPRLQVRAIDHELRVTSTWIRTPNRREAAGLEKVPSFKPLG